MKPVVNEAGLEMDDNKIGWRDAKPESYRVELWKGWVFQGSRIYDPEGNTYSLMDLKGAYLQRCLMEEFHGHDTQILSLKRELNRKIALQKLPKVCFVYESDDGVIEKVFDLE